MHNTIISILYIISCVLFIRGIKLLGKADTAQKGNKISALGMLLAVVTVLFEREVISSAGVKGYAIILVAVIIGSLIGTIWSKKVEMTGMPELVALFNGFGGLSSLLVALAEYYNKGVGTEFVNATLALTIAIGAITFTGSVVAWGKLSGKLFAKNIDFPARNLINMILAGIGTVGIIVYTLYPTLFMRYSSDFTMLTIVLITVIFLVVGITAVVPIGGGDMPVIISLLNSLSGIAAAFAGFAINNVVLVVSGCLVGASGVILTLIMCKAMNRKLHKLLFSNFGGGSGKNTGESKEPVSMSVEDAYMILESANTVSFIPGYGMAVAQAQHVVKELANRLEENGAEVNFIIHPVAGRMPGHMNVLLAEADVPYEQLKTSDEMNSQMSMQDVSIIIGANDVVNPSALTDENSPIYGMPIINAFESRTVFVLKRGAGTGFSGIENPLFTNDNTVMIYGDAKQTISALVSEFDN